MDKATMEVTNPPFFTVIIPVYNREAYIGECVDSVLSQRFTDFELIVVDDGSTDGTSQLLSTYSRDKRMRVISQSNKGRCSARNSGLHSAQGTWICFLDSDDIYFPNHLSHFKWLIDEFPRFKAFSSELTCSGEQRVYPNKKYSIGERVYEFNDFIKNNFVSLNQLCVSREVCPSFPSVDLPISEDWYFMRRLSYKVPLYKSSVVTNDVRMHDERTMEECSPDAFVRHNQRGADLFCEEVDASQSVKSKIQAHVHILSANTLLGAGMRKEGRGYLRQAWKYFPYTLQYSLLSAYYKLIFKRG